ncbi:helix-turn-helix domain-containing protein [Nocardia cyriacigeorgica]|uniref:helix-turn-helix domain-containing protein n=3 Tax=Nocardia cyriacigeorgica TaxID=135487 RepID=UPI001893B6B2|nr:helix-turn-helix transcriptional regulator [Nocardia cyriacigeorgica]MBF6395128.1 helix-turn-helix domain-containing protein [Nocardia cyriacigeorgica]MBF6400761.1 helix-turn-helix domain-containing protein [Nocardia cyriacigeorgica]
MNTEDGTGPSLPLRQLGNYFRRARSDAHLTLDQVAALMEWSPSKLSRLERGQPGKLTTRDIAALCELLEFEEDQKAAMIGLAQRATVKHWWYAYGDLIPETFNVYVGMESSARHLTFFRPDIVPGLFQTADYARILDAIYFPSDSPDEQDRRIELRMKRQRIFTRRIKPVTVEVVLHESVLRTVVGNPSVMAAQLVHLADLSTRPNVDIRVLPFGAGFPVGYAVGPYIILEFNSAPSEPTVVYVENYTGDLYLEGESDLRKYRSATAAIQRAALDAVSSRTLLRQTAKEYRK